MIDLWQYYLLLIIVSLQGLFCLRNSDKIFLFITFLELFFISGFRAWHIGNDTNVYVNLFTYAIDNYDLSFSYMEKGYLLFNKTLSLFTDKPQSILVITSFCILGPIFYFIYKYSKFIFLSTLLFVILQFSVTLNIVRQYISLIIVLLGFSFVIKRQFIKFLLCCLIATTFHTSSIVAIVLYFIYPLNIKMKNIITVFIVTILIFVFIAPFLDKVFQILGRYESYMGKTLMGEEIKLASIMKTLVNLSVFLFCFITYFFINKSKEGFSNFILRPQFLLICSLLALSIQFISIRGTIIERVATYFSFFSIISIPTFINCYPKKIRMIIAAIIIFCFICYTSIIFINRPNWNYVLPFEFCFQ